ncbi:uncharacterized protein PHACADRAFT_261048 [Phanerochaete carnosa HHB-10118-sp]|uniref:Uncharacterized protein n=1 Tax=Phanerochaete carnosa (strain HHB-10118-sp) TaxID=650164 RepID=K5W0C3_PHACS|nr:uncharacterized protein PHACADRAFT_261048 [Phanerochaete carnosa HHB-10118-sp]EKM52550.1 hypothetical protein PHACADRAFT_261048 [Phanerochaete carnosa HHB-10118-sp]
MDAKCPSGNDCELLHMSHLQASGLYTSQEWFLIRLPITSSVPWMMSTAPHFASNDIPRRKFWLQNVASGRYMAAIGLDGNIDDGNIALEVDSARASLWHFVVTTEGAFWQAYPEHFAIVTGMAPNLASLDHYAQRRVLANAKRYWTSDPHHMWKAIPRDGAFTFLNMASQCLLCQNRTAAVVDTAPPSTCDDPGCLWRLVDPRMGEPCRVLYDATANVVPPEIAGASEDVEESLQTVPPQILLRSQDAPADVVGRFAESLKAEHELVRGMLESGHTAVVLALRLVMGWKKGRISKIYLDDEDSTFGMPKFKGKEEFDPCPS